MDVHGIAHLDRQQPPATCSHDRMTKLNLVTGIAGGILAAAVALAIFAGCLWALDAVGIWHAGHGHSHFIDFGDADELG